MSENGNPLDNKISVKCLIRIQSLFRGFRARKLVELKRLRNAWLQIDQKEESELPNQHNTQLKLINQTKSNTNNRNLQEESSESDSETKPTKRKRSSDEPKKQRKSKGQSSPTATKSKSKISSPKSPRSKDSSSSSILADCPEHLIIPEIVTSDYCTRLMDYIKGNNILPCSLVLKVIDRAESLTSKQDSLCFLNSPNHSRCTIVGDLHGQLQDLLHIFNLNGLPSPRNDYIFNGDWVDRGPFSVEIVVILLTWFLCYPKNVHLNRGNHESSDLNGRDGFEKECFRKYKGRNGIQIFEKFSEFFSTLPVACVLNNEIFCVHGGLPPEVVSLEEINKIDRFHQVPPSKSLMEYLLWSDPKLKKGIGVNSRGAGITFGPDVSKRFLDHNKLKLIIRSHECVEKGYNPTHNDSLITIFSASNYCNVVDNFGAYITFTPNDSRNLSLPERTKIVTYRATPVSRQHCSSLITSCLSNDVIAKVARRISMSRLALTDYWLKLKPNTTGAPTITRDEWAKGLEVVLALNIAFKKFQKQLGLPQMGTDGKRDGVIDYMEWLAKFTPINLNIEKLEETLQAQPSENTNNNNNVINNSSPMLRTSSLHGISTLQFLVSSLHAHSYELESLFRYLDVDGDGCVSIEEFKSGINMLGNVLERPLLDRETERIIALLDKDGDGQISYQEFFTAFSPISDPQLLNEQQSQSKIIRARSNSNLPMDLINLTPIGRSHTVPLSESTNSNSNPNSNSNSNSGNGNGKSANSEASGVEPVDAPDSPTSSPKRKKKQKC